jgi:hypothetical protein
MPDGHTVDWQYLAGGEVTDEGGMTTTTRLNLRACVPILDVAGRWVKLAGDERRQYRLPAATSCAASSDYNGGGDGENESLL